MILKAIIDEHEYSLEVPDVVVAQGGEFFDKLDADMDKGWQMSREWVRHPNQVERCQIVADKLLTALENENHRLGLLMAGYILSRMPDVEKLEIDITGEIQNTRLIPREAGSQATPEAQNTRPGSSPAPSPSKKPSSEGDLDQAHGSGTARSSPDAKPSKLEAMEQAGNEVSKVYKVGKAYRFSVFNPDSGTWHDSPAIATEEEAERLRQAAFKKRFEDLYVRD